MAPTTSTSSHQEDEAQAQKRPGFWRSVAMKCLESAAEPAATAAFGFLTSTTQGAASAALGHLLTPIGIANAVIGVGGLSVGAYNAVKINRLDKAMRTKLAENADAVAAIDGRVQGLETEGRRRHKVVVGALGAVHTLVHLKTEVLQSQMQELGQHVEGQMQELGDRVQGSLHALGVEQARERQEREEERARLKATFEELNTFIQQTGSEVIRRTEDDINAGFRDHELAKIGADMTILLTTYKNAYNTDGSSSGLHERLGREEINNLRVKARETYTQAYLLNFNKTLFPHGNPIRVNLYVIRSFVLGLLGDLARDSFLTPDQQAFQAKCVGDWTKELDEDLEKEMETCLLQSGSRVSLYSLAVELAKPLATFALMRMALKLRQEGPTSGLFVMGPDATLEPASDLLWHDGLEEVRALFERPVRSPHLPESLELSKIPDLLWFCEWRGLPLDSTARTDIPTRVPTSEILQGLGIPASQQGQLGAADLPFLQLMALPEYQKEVEEGYTGLLGMRVRLRRGSQMRERGPVLDVSPGRVYALALGPDGSLFAGIGSPSGGGVGYWPPTWCVPSALEAPAGPEETQVSARFTREATSASVTALAVSSVSTARASSESSRHGLREKAAAGMHYSLFAACTDGSIKKWQATTGASPLVLVPQGNGVARDGGKGDAVRSMIVTAEGHLYAGGKSGLVHVWLASGGDVFSLQSRVPKPITALATIAGAPSQFVSGSEDGSIFLWSQQGATTLLHCTGHPITALSNGLDTRALLVGVRSRKGVVRLQLPAQGGGGVQVEELEHTTVVDEGCESLAVAADGETVFTSHDTTILVWRNNTAPVKLLDGHQNMVTTLVATQDDTLISGGFDGKIKQWA